jgi:hypothetical protein
MAKRTYKAGDRVILKANKREGWPEERGEVESDVVENGTLLVRVDECYLGEDDGDGLREVGLNQLKPLNTEASSTGRVVTGLLVKLLEHAAEDAEDVASCEVEDAMEDAGLLEDDGEDQWYAADFSDCDADRLADVPQVRRALVALIERLVGTAQQVSDA